MRPQEYCIRVCISIPCVLCRIELIWNNDNFAAQEFKFSCDGRFSYSLILLEWMNWLATIHTQVIAQNWRPERFTDEASAFEGIQGKGMEGLVESCNQINSKMENRNWAVGEQYSIADPYLLVFFRWGNRLGQNMRQFQHWTDHAERMEKKSAVQRVLQAEGISLWE